MADQPGILARGPWDIEAIEARWRQERFEPTAELSAAADARIAQLAERDSPSHDGEAARLVSHEELDGRLVVDLQPIRWALRLVGADQSRSVAAMCVVRDEQGRWLAGRRAAWVASWPGRWALGAGGAVDVGESPGTTLVRELREEWDVVPERVRGEALVLLPTGMVMFIGQAWLAAGAELTMDPEHDEYAWWPADLEQWPPEADEPLRRVGALLSA